MNPGAAIANEPARILIVDDERHNRQLLEVMLSPEGFLLQTAASGEEALAMVAQQPPDLILLDIMMPGMDGYQVAEKIKGNLATKNIPVIMVTALDDRNARMLGLSAGAEDFLTKPVDRAELVVRVRNLSRLKASGDDKYSQMLEGEVGSRTANLVSRTKTLEVTRLETGKLTVELGSVSVANAVTDSFNTLQGAAEAKGVTLSCDLLADLPRAHADQTRLRQVLIILLDNAIKFTPDGGAVTIRARLLPHDPRFLLLEVSDTGCGISPEISGRIFERLYQVSERLPTSRKGLGLGLYICKEVVTRQGGQIWVARRPEKGTTFSFTLPVASLNTSIAPLLKNDKWPAESVALVMVETSSVGPWPSKESREEWSHEARTLLQRCLLPDLDVLLPTMGVGAPGERFFVAAFADDTSASVLATRIRGQFERLLHLKQTGLTVSVSHSMLPPLPPDVGASMDTIVTSMATHLEDAIRSHIIPGAVHHE